MASSSPAPPPPPLFSYNEQISLAIIPKISSSLSLFGVTFILYHILSSSKRRKRVGYRILVGMSSMDMLFSMKTFCSTWPIPEEFGVYGSSSPRFGSITTCKVTAFIGHGSSLSSVLYNGSLTLYYFLTIYKNNTQLQIQKSWEAYFHLIPLFIGWLTASIALVKNLFVPIGWTCWIGSSPLVNSDNVTPTDATKYRWLLFHAIMWPLLGVVIIAMILIYCKIHVQEEKTRHYTTTATATTTAAATTTRTRRRGRNLIDDDDDDDNDCDDNGNDCVVGSSVLEISGRGFGSTSICGGINGGEVGLDSSNHVTTTSIIPSSLPSTEIRQQQVQKQRERRRQSLARRFAGQATCYVLALSMAWIFPMIQFVVAQRQHQRQSKNGRVMYVLLICTVIFTPLQGFLNTLIYLRPRYLNYLDRQKRARKQRMCKLQQRHQRQCEQRGQPQEELPRTKREPQPPSPLPPSTIEEGVEERKEQERQEQSLESSNKEDAGSCENSWESSSNPSSIFWARRVLQVVSSVHDIVNNEEDDLDDDPELLD